MAVLDAGCHGRNSAWDNRRSSYSDGTRRARFTTAPECQAVGGYEKGKNRARVCSNLPSVVALVPTLPPLHGPRD
eukprot:scaffold1762_cov383-Prasinococcus_capsulatus_cf.AAC.9